MRDDESGALRAYVVVLRCASAAFFAPGDCLRVPAVPTAIGPVDIRLGTRYCNRGPGLLVPGVLWVEVRGSAPPYRAVTPVFASAAFSLIPLIALSANAAVEEPEVEIAYDNTPYATERAFLQNLLPEEPSVPRRVGRRVDVPVTAALIRALAVHPERGRIRRAIGQYWEALGCWRPSRESLALAHLSLGMEALLKTFQQSLCRQEGKTQPELAAALGVRLEDLGPAIRSSRLFQNDQECCQKARKALESLEQGFATFGQGRSFSVEVRDRTARYLRSVILELLGLEEKDRAVLLSPPFDKPLGSRPEVRCLRGRLVGPAGELAAAGQEHPFMNCRASIKAISLLESGEYHVEIEEHITPSLAEGVSFQPEFPAMQGQPEAAPTDECAPGSESPGQTQQVKAAGVK